MAILDRAALLAAIGNASLPIEQVEVPELGGAVYVRGMSGTERDEWESSLVIGAGRKNQRLNTDNIRARLVTRTLCDAKGARLLENGDAAVLGGLRVDVLTRLYEIAQRLSGVTDKDVDELGKLSAPADGNGSPTN